MHPFPKELFRLGPFAITDTMLAAAVVSGCLLVVLRLAMLNKAAREGMELTYEVLERSILETTNTDARALVPLILTLWLFIGTANLLGLLPGLSSPTRDLSLAAALAAISFGAGHVYALSQRGLGYLKRYIEPSPFLLPFNVLGEVSRTLALALRLFGNMLSGALVSAIFLYLAGLLIPVPLMLLSALTAVVQAYIFGVLTLVFAASSLESAARQPILSKGNDS